MTDYIYSTVLPQKILLKSDNVIGDDNLKKDKEQIVFFEKELMTVKGKGFIVLDFGKEYFGFLKLLVCKINSSDYCAKLRIRLGESAAECCAELGHKEAGIFHGVRDLTTDIYQFSEFETPLSGFRFARVDFLTDCEFELINCKLISREEKINNVGYFKCNDESLNAIFETAKRTVTLCQQNGLIWDGIKRDRIVWIGDLMTEALAILDLSFDKERIYRCLDCAKNEAKMPFWINSIPSYSLWYIIILWELYFRTGNIVYLKNNEDYIRQILKQINGCIDETGNINFKSAAPDEDMSYFLDWESFDTADAVIGENCLILYAIKKAEKIFNELKVADDNIPSIVKKINDVSTCFTARKQIKAFQCIAYDTINNDDVQQILDERNGGVSCFMTYFILKVLCKAGKYDSALKIVREYYGGMLKMGATTFFEDFDLRWLKDDPLPLYEFEREGRKHIHADYGRFCYKGFRHSCCHGWSVGVIPLLLEEIVGVKIIENGYKSIKISPNLCNLQFVEAGIPTPFGLIEIKAYKKDGKTVVEKIVPQGIKVVK